MQIQVKDREQIKQELSEILDKYYNGSFALLVREYIRTAGMTEEEREALVEDVKKEWERIDESYSVPYYPHVSCGWDNNPRYRRFRGNITKNNTPENLEKALQMAKEYLDSHPDIAPLVTVNSWNEWTETSYLQPDDLYGYGYLEAVKKVFCDEE
jgi:hypothetical protein